MDDWAWQKDALALRRLMHELHCIQESITVHTISLRIYRQLFEGHSD
jgi:hypothetical protein